MTRIRTTLSATLRATRQKMTDASLLEPGISELADRRQRAAGPQVALVIFLSEKNKTTIISVGTVVLVLLTLALLIVAPLLQIPLCQPLAGVRILPATYGCHSRHGLRQERRT